MPLPPSRAWQFPRLRLSRHRLRSRLRDLTTHFFVKGDPFIDADPVFAAKRSLIVDFARHDEPAEAEARKTTAPFYTVECDFALTAR